VPNVGIATSALTFPNDPAIIGATFFHQYVPFELDVTLAITAITASNALQLTLGSF
jgi:hypothetical protein